MSMENEETTTTGFVFPAARVADDLVPGRIGGEPVPGQVHDETPEAAAARGAYVLDDEGIKHAPEEVLADEDEDEDENEEEPSAGTSSSDSESNEQSSSEKPSTSNDKPAQTTVSRTESALTDSSTARSTGTAPKSAKHNKAGH